MEELLLVIVQFDKEGGRIVTEFFPFLNPFSCETSFDCDDDVTVAAANKLEDLLVLLVMSVFLVFLIKLVVIFLLFCSDVDVSRVLLVEIIPHSLAPPPPLALLLFLAFTTADKATITFSLLLLLTLLLLLDGFLMAVEIGVVAVVVAMVQVLFVGNIPTKLLLLP